MSIVATVIVIHIHLFLLSAYTMDVDVVRKSLQNAGFSQYEALVYVALVRRGAASAVTVAEESGVPKSRVYDVLRDLEAEDLIETYKQDSLHARALSPDSIIAALREQANSFSEAADELRDMWEASDLDDHDLTIVKRFETVVERTKSLIRTAENEIQLAGTTAQYDELRPVLHEAYGRGVFIKLSLYRPEGSRSTIDTEFEFENTASEVCSRDLPTPFVALIDRSQTCFAPQRGSGYEFGILATNRPLTYVFHWYYQTSLWDNWDVVYSTRGSSPPITYVNIRQCVVDIAPLYHEGAIIEVRAEVSDTESGDVHAISGRVVDLVYTRSRSANIYPALSDISGQVSIFIDDGDRTHSLGGWYAKVEDFELRRLTIESIEMGATDDGSSD